MKKIPNILSLSRILLSLAMFFVMDYPFALVSMLLLAGLTDVADGFIARRYRCESTTGARLDSLGDWIFFAVAGIVFLLRYKRIVDENIYQLLTVIGVRFFSLCIARYKFGRFLSIHTTGNKITGVMIVITLVIIVLRADVGEVTVKVVLAAALLSALEELLILLVNKDVDLNQRGFFCKKTGLK